MKQILLFSIGLILLLAVPTKAQTTDTTVIPFISYWSTGDSYFYKVTKKKKKWSNGKSTANDSLTYFANFQVIDSTATSYTIKWIFQTDFKRFNISTSSIKQLNKYRLTEVIYTTTEMGEFVGVTNWREISAQTKEMYASILELEKKVNPFKAERLKPLIATMSSVYSSKDGIEQLVLKELTYFHFPFGVEIPTNESIKYPERLPNLMGGKPIKAKAELEVTEADFENSFCVLHHKMKVDQKDATKFLKSVIDKIGLSDKDFEKAMKTAKFEINDNNEYHYFFYPGVPVFIKTSREAVLYVANIQTLQVETIELELLPENEISDL